MNESSLRLIVAPLWLAWLFYWFISARNVKPTRVHEPLGSQLRHRLPLLLAAALLALPSRLPPVLTRRFLPQGGLVPALGVVLVAAGLGFSIWARRHLGGNWSANVVVKEEHALIRTGPYRHVRHPIYTGLLLALSGMALILGEWRALLALLSVAVAFAFKSRAEESRMREVFPEYRQYQRETAALVPYLY